MAVIEPAPAKSFGEKLQSVNRVTLYFILILGASIPAFFPFPVPNKPIEPSIAFFESVSSLQEGESVLIETDWTKSTRGESMGHMEGLLRMLMRNKVKFAIYSCADPQAPRVARDVIERIAAENLKEGGVEYKRWEYWLDLGYFPNAEGTNSSIAANVRKAFQGKTELPGPGLQPRNVWESPVLEKIQKIEDFKRVIIVTASNTFNVMVERLSPKTDMLAAVTGVMVPESQVYFDSGQVKGLSGGLKGVYDMETLMKTKWPSMTNEGKGKAYYPTLHVVLAIMMLAIIIGNIGMFLAKKGAWSLMERLLSYDGVKLTFGVLATIGLYSVLYRENKFYRFWEHIFLGLASGWALVALWTESLKDSWWAPMVGNSDIQEPGRWAWALLLPIGLMGYFVFSRKHNWLSRIPIGIILGLWSGQQIWVWWTRYGPQINSSLKPIFPTTGSSFFAPYVDPAAPDAAVRNNVVYPSEAISNLIFVLTLLAVMSYFLFSFDFKNKFVLRATTTGRWLLMIGFGAIFGSTVMMRFSLLIDRMYFIWIEWFQNTVLGQGPGV